MNINSSTWPNHARPRTRRGAGARPPCRGGLRGVPCARPVRKDSLSLGRQAPAHAMRKKAATLICAGVMMLFHTIMVVVTLVRDGGGGENSGWAVMLFDADQLER